MERQEWRLESGFKGALDAVFCNTFGALNILRPFRVFYKPGFGAGVEGLSEASGAGAVGAVGASGEMGKRKEGAQCRRARPRTFHRRSKREASSLIATRSRGGGRGGVTGESGRA